MSELVQIGIDKDIIPPAPKRIILTNWQSPGDILMLTAAIRDLHKAYPNRFDVGVNTSCEEIWYNNPGVTKVSSKDTPKDWLPEGHGGTVPMMQMHYPLIHRSNFQPYHFLHGFTEYLEQQLQLRIPVTDYKGDIYLTEEEKVRPSKVEQLTGYTGKYWIMMAGGKNDYTTKIWSPQYYQEVVNHFKGKIKFAQFGNSSDFHPPLDGTINMVGKTTIREFMLCMYHAEGVICPVTFAMHLAAATPNKNVIPTQKPVVVIAGGREPPSFTMYNGHQYLANTNCLPCAQNNGCWRSRVAPIGDGDLKDYENLCLQPIKVGPELHIAKCMMLIRPGDVIRSVESWYEGGVLQYL